MVLIELSMSPMDQGVSVSKFVARSLAIIDASGLDYRLNAMGTIIEGEWDEVMAVVTQCFERMKEDCDRISISIKADYRKGHCGRLDAKVDAVEQKLGRKLRT